MAIGQGVIRGHLITLRRFLLTFWRDIRRGQGLTGAGGGRLLVDFFRTPARGNETTVQQDYTTDGLFTVEYPDERLPVYERFRVLPMLVYDTEDGNVRCTSCNICAKVCPPQCIWMSQAKSPKGTVVPLPEDFYIDMDVCMNCGLCSEYCPFDAIKMDQNFELSNYERHQTHIYSLQDLLVSSEYYAKTHPEAWSSSDEVTERNKVAKKKDQRLQKALAATKAHPRRPRRRPSRRRSDRAGLRRSRRSLAWIAKFPGLTNRLGRAEQKFDSAQALASPTRAPDFELPLPILLTSSLPCEHGITVAPNCHIAGLRTTLSFALPENLVR